MDVERGAVPIGEGGLELRGCDASGLVCVNPGPDNSYKNYTHEKLPWLVLPPTVIL